MEEIRSERYQNILRSPGPRPKDVPIDEQAEALFRTENDGIRAIGGTVRQACDCGCLEEPGGYCVACMAEGSDGIACVHCFHHCAVSGCGIGLCLSHSYQIENPPGELRRFCPNCYAALQHAQERERRRRLILFPIRFLVWIFFKPVEREDEPLQQKQVETHPLRPTQPRHLPFEFNAAQQKSRSNDEQHS